MTVGQHATHSAGLEKPDPSSVADDGQMLAKSGTRWRYSDAGRNWLADVPTVTFDDDLDSVITNSVLQSLGITTGVMWRDNQLRGPTLLNSQGNPIARRELASGMFAGVDAMARVGYLFRHRGVWNGQRTISESSIDLVQIPRQSVIGSPVGLAPEEPPAASEHYGVLW